LLLQRLHLMLGRDKLVVKEDHLLRCRKWFFGLLGFPRRWCFAPDVVEVILPVCPKLWMPELPGLG
jgi:hypothetical protein